MATEAAPQTDAWWLRPPEALQQALAPPGEFFALVALLAAAYLGIVEVTKRVFYARFARPAA